MELRCALVSPTSHSNEHFSPSLVSSRRSLALLLLLLSLDPYSNTSMSRDEYINKVHICIDRSVHRTILLLLLLVLFCDCFSPRLITGTRRFAIDRLSRLANYGLH